MDTKSLKYDPSQVLAQQRQFAEQHGIDLSPYPKKLATPEGPSEQHNLRAGSDYKESYEDNGKYSAEGEEKELLIMTIEIGDGQKDTLRVFENDDPNDLAKAFCDKHGLNPNIIYPLAQNIYSNMEQVLQERLEALNYGGSEYAEGNQEGQEYSKFPEQKTGGFRAEDQNYEDPANEKENVEKNDQDSKYAFETADTHQYNAAVNQTLDRYDQSNNPAHNNNTLAPQYPPHQNYQQQAVNQSYDSKRYSANKGPSPNKTSNRARTPEASKENKKHNTDYPADNAIKKSIYYPENFQTGK
jgi:hypothetical protein